MSSLRIKIKRPIQVINNCYNSKLFNWNNDLFITHDFPSFSLYKKIFGTISYQLISKITIPQKFSSFYKLLKLDNKTLLVSNHNNIYLVDIKRIKIYHNISFFDKFNDIKFKNKNMIYIYYNNNLFMFQYFKNRMILIKIIQKNELVAFKYLLNLSIHECYKNINKNLIINFIENKYKNLSSFQYFLLLLNKQWPMIPIKMDIKFLSFLFA